MVERPRRRWRWLLVGLMVVAVAAAGLFGYLRSTRNRTLSAELPPAGAVVEKPDRVSILFAGDTHFGESYFTDPVRPSPVAEHGYDYPLEGIAPLARTADFVVLNLETPLTNERNSPLRSVKRWVHWGDPEPSAEALARLGVRAVSLANNHASDALEAGLASTRTVLGKHDIHAFGAGATLAEAAQPFRADLRIGKRLLRLVVIGAHEENSADRKNGTYAAMDRPGVNPLEGDALVAQIRALKKRGPNLFVVVFPHWGRNYAWRSPAQAKLGHRFIDAGADLVLGHGAHLFQEIEPYRGRIIAYSLGNFVFQSPGRYKAKNMHSSSQVARLEFSERSGKLVASLVVYLIASDNRKTRYQPRLLRGRAFESAWQELLDQDSVPAPARDELRRMAQQGRDAVGDHVRIELGEI